MTHPDSPGRRVGVIVVAAGKGARMGGEDKIFAPLAGRPVLAHCLEVFESSPLVTAISVVLSRENSGRGRALLNQRFYNTEIAIAEGAGRRQDSVRAGLEALMAGGRDSAFDCLAVHDAARPFVDAEMIERGVAAALDAGAAVAAVPASDTVKVVGEDGAVLETLDRSRLWLVQTPQMFRPGLLREAHSRIAANATDDAAMVESIGGRVTVFEGGRDNLKITTPADLAIAEAVAARREGPSAGDSGTRARWGVGFDGHALVEGRPLMLGGFRVPFERGLAGHSDGDALLHAIADALIGAGGLGDLGKHFPSSDPALAGIDSRAIISQVVNMLSERGWVPQFVDATIVAQRPILRPYLQEIARNVASALGLPAEAVNLKATSTDRLGAIGQGQGIAACAIATLHRR